MSTVGLRPLRMGEILDRGIKLYLGNARALMGAAATVVVPLQLVLAAVLMSTYSDGNDIGGFGGLSGKTISQAEANARLGASGITFFASLIGTALVTAACIKAVSDSYLDQPTGIEESLRFALRRLIPLVTMLVLSYLLMLVSFVLLIIPGIWMFTNLIAATPSLLIERLSPTAAIGRSRRLVKGRWWSTAGVQLVYTLMIAVLGGVVTGVLLAIALSDSNPSVVFAVTISGLAGIVSGIVLQPLGAAMVTVIYYDLRVRQEGFDLQLLAEQLGLPEGSLVAEDGARGEGFSAPMGPEMVGKPGGPPFWPPPPGWRPGQ